MLVMPEWVAWVFALWCLHMASQAALWLQHGQHTHSFTALWPLPTAVQGCRHCPVHTPPLLCSSCLPVLAVCVCESV